VNFAAGQLPDQPGFHCAEQELAALSTGTDARDVLKDPAKFGSGEVGINHEAGLGAERVRQTLGLQRVAILTGAAALPDDGVIDGFTGFLIPNNGGFALVGNADRSNVRCRSTNFLHGFHGNAKLCCPDLICVVFHPAGFREILREFTLCNAAHFTALIEENAAVGSCAGIKRHYVFCHNRLILPFSLLVCRVWLYVLLILS